MLAHVTPAGGRVGQFHVQTFQRLLHLRHGQVHQPGMPVHPAAFIGDPIGAQITLFKHMHRHPLGPGDLHGPGVDRPRVAIKHDVGDGFLRDQVAERLRPLFQRALVGDIVVRVGPEGAVAPVEAHAPHLGPGGRHHAAQPVEIRSVRPLQEQEPPPLARNALYPLHMP